MEEGRSQEQRNRRAKRRHDDDDFQRVSDVPNSCSASFSEREMFHESVHPSPQMGGMDGDRSTFTNVATQSVFFFIVNEMGLRRRHMKRGHSNTWSHRHKYISACITNIEIPDEMSVFTGLKTLTEKRL